MTLETNKLNSGPFIHARKLYITKGSKYPETMNQRMTLTSLIEEAGDPRKYHGKQVTANSSRFAVRWQSCNLIGRCSTCSVATLNGESRLQCGGSNIFFKSVPRPALPPLVYRGVFCLRPYEEQSNITAGGGDR